MGTGEKIASGIIAIGMITTLILPKRQTPAVIDAAGKFTSGVMGTAMGTGKAA